MSNTLLSKSAIRWRRLVSGGHNIFFTVISLFAALLLRFDLDIGETLEALDPRALGVLLLLRVITYEYYGVSSSYWRYFSSRDLELLIKAHIVSAVLFAATLMLIQPLGFPRSVIFIEFFISVMLAGGSRLLVRLLSERSSIGKVRSRAEQREVIVLGAGISGHLAVKMLLSNPRLRYRPVVVLDDSEYLLKTEVHGVRVSGPLAQLGSTLKEYPHVGAVLLAIPSLSESRFTEVDSICKQCNVPLKRIQSFEDIACVDAHAVTESLSIESFLQRQVHIEHEDEVRESLRGKRVMITGAGGSIGSEIVRQLAPFKPSRLVLIDSCEFNLYKIEREMRTHLPEGEAKAVLANISEESRLLAIMQEEKPHVVFHTAAYKHVPLLEFHPHAAFRNNIIGTRNVLRGSAQCGVDKFVMISTDKAVDPSSIMGCSKRIAEFLVQSFDASTPALQTAVVRFGNVINSAGSVVPLFREQILSGGPITVTHPDITRYFMSISEAVKLVLTAGTLGSRGEIYILDMGKPIKIVDVAKKMLSLYGRRDVPIVFTGLRPGEKLNEELTDFGEELFPTRFKKINRSLHTFATSMGIEAWVEDLELVVDRLEPDELIEILRSKVQALTRPVIVKETVSETEEQLKIAQNANSALRSELIDNQ